jgi:anti-anti-sigma regulatory factor
MSAVAGTPASAADGSPLHAVAALPLPADRLSVVVNRLRSAVIVTTSGWLDQPGSELLEGLLTDLLVDEHNFTVTVDLTRARVDSTTNQVFIRAAARARRTGTRFLLVVPTPATRAARESNGREDLGDLGDLVEIVSRQAARG